MVALAAQTGDVGMLSGWVLTCTQGSTLELSEALWSSPLSPWPSTLSRNTRMTPDLNLDLFNKYWFVRRQSLAFHQVLDPCFQEADRRRS